MARNLMRLLAIFALVFVVAMDAKPVLSQSKEHPQCVVQDMDTPTMPKCVIQSRSGAMFIPKRYWMHPSFNQYDLAAFTIQSFGRVYINRTGRIVIRDVAFMDNGPDEFHHGVVRVEHDGKWGYADASGRITVPMQYSCALNYKDQHTDLGPLVCIGCRSEVHDEYRDCVEGQWFHVDAHGNLTPTSRPNR